MLESISDTAAKRMMALPNCSRSRAYFSASRYAASHRPTDWAPMPRRAAFMSDITYLMRPILRSPTSCAGAFVKTSSHVGEPLMPSLFSMRRTFTPPSRLS